MLTYLGVVHKICRRGKGVKNRQSYLVKRQQSGRVGGWMGCENLRFLDILYGWPLLECVKYASFHRKEICVWLRYVIVVLSNLLN